MINKVTKLRTESGEPLDEEIIQTHLDTNNADGWYLVTVSNLGGWYRFFWAKEEI